MTRALKLNSRINSISLLVVMLLWGLYLGYPLHHLQNVRSTVAGYVVPIYYFLTVLPMIGAAAVTLAFKRNWNIWELLWWLLPATCVPAILHSGDMIWSIRQWSSWSVRGIIPGGILFLVACHRRPDSKLLYWIYPIIVAASLLGLAEIYYGHNPLWESLHIPILQTSQPNNPFYRPNDSFSISWMPQGTQGNRIPYTSTIVAFIPLGLWLLKYAKKYRWAYLFAIVTIFSILLLALSRSAWIGMLATTILMPILGFQRNSRQTIKIFSGALLCFGIFLALPKTSHMLLYRFRSFHLTNNSIHERLMVLQTAKILKKHWLLGVGYGQFPTACESYYPNSMDWHGTPDNQYLRWAIENGLLSFAMLLAFLIGLIHAAWKKIQLIQDIQQADFYKSLFAGWFSVAVTFLFFDGFYWGACNMTFWCFLGLFATCLKFSPNNPAQEPREALEKS